MNILEQNKILKNALQILVDAKDRKEEFGDKDFTYLVLKGEGWAKARHALKVCKEHEAEKDLNIDEAKCLVYYGKTNDNKVSLNDDDGEIAYPMHFMFGQLNTNIRTDIETIFWNRILKIVNNGI